MMTFSIRFLLDGLFGFISSFEDLFGERDMHGTLILKFLEKL